MFFIVSAHAHDILILLNIFVVMTFSSHVQMPQDFLHLAAYFASLHLVEVVAAEQSFCESPQPVEKKCDVKYLCLE
jgi:hypothetical protein